jgi:hypothetical protein
MKIPLLMRFLIVASTCLASTFTYADWTKPLRKAGFSGTLVTGFEAGVPTAVDVFVARDIVYRPKPIQGWSNYTPEFSSLILTLAARAHFMLAFTETTNDVRTAKGALISSIEGRALEKPILLLTPRTDSYFLKQSLLFLLRKKIESGDRFAHACNFELLMTTLSEVAK